MLMFENKRQKHDVQIKKMVFGRLNMCQNKTGWYGPSMDGPPRRSTQFVEHVLLTTAKRFV